MWMRVYRSWKMNFNSKNGRKRHFFVETKALISFMPMRRMHLWWLLMKRREIIMWIHFCPNWWTNINSKNGRKRCFSFVTKAWISFIPMRRMNMWCPTIKIKEIIIWICVYLIEKWTLILKIVAGDVFLMKSKRQYQLSQWGECVYDANHEIKGDYDMNPCLS